ncbi:hypothetical protein [Escherichia coli]|uniref:hypothetical protein n=1 Tax=Escherichia coli TaxID=562 RepID=UPI002104BCF2|nr:hypothetical protein [Escherichia coli]MCQ1763655.1 hypothetical protein [Escherichia coli]
MFSHPVYLFLREFSLQDSRGGSVESFAQQEADKFKEALLETLRNMQENKKPT